MVVPCVAAPYPDFVVGLREHLPPADAPAPGPDDDAAALQATLHDLQFGGDRCVVGSLWSNVGRLAYELSAADKGCLPPLISRDVGWCSVDGQLQDGTVYGHLNC